MLRYTALLFSFVMHPIFIITYMLILLILINPYLFGVSSIGDFEVKKLILVIFLMTVFIPGFAIGMMKAVGLVNSVHMNEREERYGPFIATGIFYLATFRYLLYYPQVPLAFKIFVLGSCIGLFVAFFINLWSKISLHAVGMGGLIGMIVITMALFSYDSVMIPMSVFGTLHVSTVILLMAGIILAGIVGTSRLILEAHEPIDLYGGYMVGFITQFIGLYFLYF